MLFMLIFNSDCMYFIIDSASKNIYFLIFSCSIDKDLPIIEQHHSNSCSNGILNLKYEKRVELSSRECIPLLKTLSSLDNFENGKV